MTFINRNREKALRSRIPDHMKFADNTLQRILKFRSRLMKGHRDEGTLITSLSSFGTGEGRFLSFRSSSPPQMSHTIARISQHLEQAGRTHAAADAHGDDNVFCAAALAFDQRVAGETRAGHAIRVADGNAATIHVQ